MRRITLTLLVVICVTTFAIGLPCHGTYGGGGGTAPGYYSAPSGGGGYSGGSGYPSGGAPSGGGGGGGFMGTMTGMAENLMQYTKKMKG